MFLPTFKPSADPALSPLSLPVSRQYVDDLGTPLGNAQLFSAHQMGSCRMAVSPREGVVDEEGQCHEVKGLYIMDASVFPTSLGAFRQLGLV